MSLMNFSVSIQIPFCNTQRQVMDIYKIHILWVLLTTGPNKIENHQKNTH